MRRKAAWAGSTVALCAATAIAAGSVGLGLTVTMNDSAWAVATLGSIALALVGGLALTVLPATRAVGVGLIVGAVLAVVVLLTLAFTVLGPQME
ncbi:hypothetical protein H5V45_18310 [Nocardioides sp. KIGAM211]|uniref:Major facilitator superfamily (MFS) profile domain-containing protein n=1 Tax=Nocardioides luti TaxID=2761101 RepID=A0A7X0RJ65_9ACTN|nr:hypothetical protein [Nocardioides luti]MBB6629286.1 hypothetical protein [Nocardioides luti]